MNMLVENVQPLYMSKQVKCNSKGPLIESNFNDGLHGNLINPIVICPRFISCAYNTVLRPKCGCKFLDFVRPFMEHKGKTFVINFLCVYSQW